jgi:hypothetical protein
MILQSNMAMLVTAQSTRTPLQNLEQVLTVLASEELTTTDALQPALRQYAEATLT